MNLRLAKMLLTKIVIKAYRRHGDRSCDPKPPPTHPPVSPESAAGLFQAGVLFTDEMQHMMTHKTRRLQATRCQRKLMAALMGVRAARPVCARAFPSCVRVFLPASSHSCRAAQCPSGWYVCITVKNSVFQCRTFSYCHSRCT